MQNTTPPRKTDINTGDTIHFEKDGVHDMAQVTGLYYEHGEWALCTTKGKFTESYPLMGKVNGLFLHEDKLYLEAVLSGTSI